MAHTPDRLDTSPHLLVVLFAGDYREASRRRAAGEPDQYRHHSYAIASLERIRAEGHRVTVVQMRSDDAYDEQGDGGIRYRGLGPMPSADAHQRIVQMVARESVTHVAVRFPSAQLLEHLLGLPTPPSVAVILADSFPNRIRARRRYGALAGVLADPGVDLIANHQVNSSRQLAKVMKLDPERVVPWDWPQDLVEMSRSSSRAGPAREPIRLLYVGSISRFKGVWDVIRALSILRSRGLDVVLDIAGSGQVDEMWQVADRSSVRAHVSFHGRVDEEEVLRLMQRATFVVVPSHHSYPEGLPLTLYEAMASGTPVVASDHPMFRGVVRHRETGFVYRARRPRRLAKAVRTAWRDGEAYRHVSATASAAYPTMGLDTLWGEMLLRWVRGAAADHEWLRERSLAARLGR